MHPIMDEWGLIAPPNHKRLETMIAIAIQILPPLRFRLDFIRLHLGQIQWAGCHLHLMHALTIFSARYHQLRTVRLSIPTALTIACTEQPYTSREITSRTVLGTKCIQ